MMLRVFLVLAFYCLIAGVPTTRADESPAAGSSPRIVSIPMSDGVRIAAKIYLPAGGQRSPTLLAASPYRFDNDSIPSRSVYLFRETGPIGWYVANGYSYVNMDVRGTGRSGGLYRDQDPREQRDLFEVIEWIARQTWSSGKVGGIGQSYFAREQWSMAVQRPPHLACIAPYDGNIDGYTASAYVGGVRGATYPARWFSQLQFINRDPATGPSRFFDGWNYPAEVNAHPLYDDFWRQRSVVEQLPQVTVPVLSIGIWGKVDLHLNGNIVGYQRLTSPKKLLLIGGDVAAAVSNYASVKFHENYLKPFYDWCLKGDNTSYPTRPNVSWMPQNATVWRNAPSWPSPDVSYQSWFLSPEHSDSVDSLNDGSLVREPLPGGTPATTYDYPNSGWQSGVVGPGPDGRPDPARRVLTFTTAPLDKDLEIAGPIELVLWLSSDNEDEDIFVKLSDQSPRTTQESASHLNPISTIVTKGWLRASHRSIDEHWSLPHAPWYRHTREDKLIAGVPTELRIAVVPNAYIFHKGNRIRLEIANGDSAATEGIFFHFYSPRAVGQDRFLHDVDHPSRLILPLIAVSPLSVPAGTHQ